MPDAPSPDLALFLPSLAGGGVARVMLNLAQAFRDRDLDVVVVVCRDEGAHRDSVPSGVRVVELQAGSRIAARRLAANACPKGWRAVLRPVLLATRGAPPLRYLGDLARWLEQERPSVLISAKTHSNLVALWARKLAGVPTRVIATQHSMLSAEMASPKGRLWRWRYVAEPSSTTYPLADAVVAVSEAVADDLARVIHYPRSEIRTIYNPVITPETLEQARAPLEHPWLAASAPPCVLAVGRLRAAKDFPTLLRAFERVRRERSCRLLILGEGEQRESLLALARSLGIEQDVELRGFVTNPLAYMARAAALVQSSLHEALPGVLIEALVCGCPVVCTDAPGGSREILEDGRHGALVPVGDAEALARAIGSVLDDPGEAGPRIERAHAFSVEAAADRYLQLAGLASSEADARCDDGEPEAPAATPPQQR